MGFKYVITNTYLFSHSQLPPHVPTSIHFLLLLHPPSPTPFHLRHLPREPHVRTRALISPEPVWDLAVQGSSVCCRRVRGWAVQDGGIEPVDQDEEGDGPGFRDTERGPADSFERGLFTGVSSNLRYQGLNGVEFLVAKWVSLPVVFKGDGGGFE